MMLDDGNIMLDNLLMMSLVFFFGGKNIYYRNHPEPMVFAHDVFLHIFP